MFSFHKPKIYRSNLGCCICKAKSSSSRFTDSKKYENEFENCFRIQEKRSGEICNACVLLVKRWKKLSPENRLTKHWHHVVDARAGPGTKLTSGRRVTASSSMKQAELSAHCQRQSGGAGNVLPLSSSQANNQSAAATSSAASSAPSSGGLERSSKRSSTFSTNKARAIDTNVSTFTFGEPIRRGYMNQTGQQQASYSGGSYAQLSSAHFGKPQSALSSSAFESVIKRFRQRQQQQQLEAERRQLNRRQRAGPAASVPSVRVEEVEVESKRPKDEKEQSAGNNSSSSNNNNNNNNNKLQPGGNKRVKRPSESIGSLTVDGLRVSSLLDQTVWRKERICCGIIFRGLYNEVAVFPKLLKPCQCRVNKQKEQQIRLKQQQQQQSLRKPDEDETPQKRSGSPPPRATKSGSISSCDSNTSGTGSMEEPLVGAAGVQLARAAGNTKPGRPARRSGKTSAPAPAKRPTRLPGIKRQPRKTTDETDSIISSSSSGFSSTLAKTSAKTVNQQQQQQQQQQLRSPSNSSSSSRLLLMADDEDDDGESDEMVLDEEELELEMEEDEDDEDDDDDDDDEEEDEEEMEEDDEEVEEDSSVESLAGVERKKSTTAAVAMA